MTNVHDISAYERDLRDIVARNHRALDEDLPAISLGTLRGVLDDLERLRKDRDEWHETANSLHESMRWISSLQNPEAEAMRLRMKVAELEDRLLATGQWHAGVK
jgi:hypothetical protein